LSIYEHIYIKVFQSPEGVICFCASLHSRKDFWSAGICVEPLRSGRSYPMLLHQRMYYWNYLRHQFLRRNRCITNIQIKNENSKFKLYMSILIVTSNLL
jgi:hypothetical protein